MKQLIKAAKRVFFYILTLCLICFVSFATLAVLEGEMYGDNIIASLDCEYKRTHHFDTSFRKIFTFSRYTLNSPHIDTELLVPVTNDVLPHIMHLIEVFEGSVDSHRACVEYSGYCEVLENYCYDIRSLDNFDYFWIDGQAFVYAVDGFLKDYNLYILDTESSALYHFHTTD